jgi:hypothetical protein
VRSAIRNEASPALDTGAPGVSFIGNQMNS